LIAAARAERERAVLMDFYALDRAEYDALTVSEFQARVLYRNQVLGEEGEERSRDV